MVTNIYIFSMGFCPNDYCSNFDTLFDNDLMRKKNYIINYYCPNRVVFPLCFL